MEISVRDPPQALPHLVTYPKDFIAYYRYTFPLYLSLIQKKL